MKTVPSTNTWTTGRAAEAVNRVPQAEQQGFRAIYIWTLL